MVEQAQLVYSTVVTARNTQKKGRRTEKVSLVILRKEALYQILQVRKETCKRLSRLSCSRVKAFSLELQSRRLHFSCNELQLFALLESLAAPIRSLTSTDVSTVVGTSKASQIFSI